MEDTDLINLDADDAMNHIEYEPTLRQVMCGWCGFVSTYTGSCECCGEVLDD